MCVKYFKKNVYKIFYKKYIINTNLNLFINIYL